MGSRTGREWYSSASPFEASVGFSRAVRVGERVLVSGSAPIGPDGETVAGGVEAQARRCVAILVEAVEAFGGTAADVVRTRTYLTRREDWELAARVHGEAFAEARPAATMVVVPAGLRLVGRRGGTGVNTPRRPPGLLLGVDRLAQGRPLAVLVVGLLITAGVTAGVHRMRVETNMLSYFHPEAEVVQHSLRIEQVYGGAAPLDIVVDAGEPGGALDPTVLDGIAALQTHLASMEGVVRGVSVADLLIDVRRATTGDVDAGLPASAAESAQLLMLPDPDVVDLVVDLERRTTRVSTRFAGAGRGLKWSRGLLADVEQACADTLGGRAEVRLTGSSVLFVHMDRYLVTGQVRSLVIVLALIAGIMIVLFGSLRVGLLAMIPNVLPIAALLGAMGWLDMPLDGLTVMIACIAIGIGVDDTIHYLVHLRREMRAGADLGTAMTRTIGSVGRAIVFTSVVLALGFGVFCTSDFVGTRNFGLLTALTVLVALVADLLVLPAALKVLGVPRGWGDPR